MASSLLTFPKEFRGFCSLMNPKLDLAVTIHNRPKGRNFKSLWLLQGARNIDKQPPISRAHTWSQARHFWPRADFKSKSWVEFIAICICVWEAIARQTRAKQQRESGLGKAALGGLGYLDKLVHTGLRLEIQTVWQEIILIIVWHEQPVRLRNSAEAYWQEASLSWQQHS